MFEQCDQNGNSEAPVWCVFPAASLVKNALVDASSPEQCRDHLCLLVDFWLREIKQDAFNLTALCRTKQVTFCHWVDASRLFSRRVYVHTREIRPCLASR